MTIRSFYELRIGEVVRHNGRTLVIKAYSSGFAVCRTPEGEWVYIEKTDLKEVQRWHTATV